MPHIAVKLVPGKSEEQKTRLVEEIVQEVMKVLLYGEEAVSVAFEKVEPLSPIIGSAPAQPRQESHLSRPTLEHRRRQGLPIKNSDD